MTYPSYPSPDSNTPKMSMMAIFAMVLGLLSFCLTIIAGIPAIILGIVALAKINREPQNFSGKGFAITGIVTGALGTVVVPVIALLVAILLPGLGRAHEMANRATCQQNLLMISKACFVYAADNNDAYPLVGGGIRAGTNSYDVGTNPAPTSSATSLSDLLGGTTPGSLYEPANAGFNVPQANLWILALQGFIPTKSLLCKSDPYASAGASPLSDASNRYYLYPSQPNQFSYSIAFPWNTKQAGAASYWRNTSDPSVPLMSDMALRQASRDNLSSTGKQLNSPNHNGGGQNVAYGDAHVEWNPDPSKAASMTNDSIFHFGGLTYSGFGPNQEQGSSGIKIAQPTPGTFDIYLVPQRDASGTLR